ncbi:acyl-coenzyme A thioesterase 1-like isoform 1-T3 [Synchiropus picturatus]
MSSQVRLLLLPGSRCLFDEAVRIKVSGLRPRQLVNMAARVTDEKRVVFSSRAWYKANDDGELDLNRDISLGGSYVGVEPMGLLWSMTPDKPHKRLQKVRSLDPHVVTFSVQEEGGSTLAEVHSERSLIGPGVSRKVIKQQNTRGVLFTPPGEGPFPAVLDLYTLGGGVSEKRASLLASRGFVVLAIALYSYTDMPDNIQEIHLDCFEEAIDILRKQDKVCQGGVGVISLSKSGDLALSIASYLPSVKATVWINGCCANTLLPLYYRGQQLLPPLMYDISKITPTESGAVNIKQALFSPRAPQNQATLIPIEKAESQFLFVASEADLNWDSRGFVSQMVERLQHHGKKNYEVLNYSGAGHYLEPPYGPYCPSSVHSLVKKPVLWGGEAKCHAAAEVHLWGKLQEFLRRHLCQEPSNKTSKL